MYLSKKIGENQLKDLVESLGFDYEHFRYSLGCNSISEIKGYTITSKDAGLLVKKGKKVILRYRMIEEKEA